MKKRWKLTIEYKGTGYCGWQRQADGVPSVQQAIEDAFYGFCQQRLTLHVAGRTDAGVHASGQVAHIDLDYGDRPLEGFDLVKALNAHLRPQPVCIVDAAVVDEQFHARFDAVNKLYRYRIVNRSAPMALEAGLAWHVKKKLDWQAMHDAAQILLGHHDFTTFRDTQCQAKSPERTLDRLDITARPYDECGGMEIMIETEAQSFLHHQVRNMVGTLALVGEGKWNKDDVAKALAAKDRTAGGPTCPADGLYLVRVDY
ncbi:MAG: tRNA pseudouridine(38-40) synthase TruA [Rhodospirillales bacterium]|nr:tRNA pseudouridine(38-40) synthase TruA [Rhodospirillales bacterium]MCB9997267.1 tRNA pseudouridine(38-40) synthase TruA [Rhodospirillales bacterium]